MAKLVDSKLPRRSFLTGAASLVGATVMGLPKLARADDGGRGNLKKSPVSIGFWDGSRFVSADRLEAGDATLGSVRLDMRGYGSGSVLGSISVSSWASTSTGNGWAPFLAWQAPPQGCGKARFVMPVDTTHGLRISTQEVSGGAASVTDINLIAGTGSGPKIQAGTYVVAVGRVNWDSYHLDTSAAGGPVVAMLGAPALPHYVVVNLTRGE